MKSVLIVGYGIVGHNVAKELEKLKPDIYDKYKPEHNTKKDIKYDFVFICVDTPYIDKKTPCDISQVKEALKENDADIYIIKSTVLPKTTLMLQKETGKRIVFSPEYYGETQNCNNYKFDFTILGGSKPSCIEVIQLLQDVYDGRHVFEMTDSTTAEFVKYMENVDLATRVCEHVAFFEEAEKIGVYYEEARRLYLHDPRMNKSHTNVFREHPYYDSKCLNKDVAAFVEFTGSEFFKFIEEYNNMQKFKKGE